MAGKGDLGSGSGAVNNILCILYGNCKFYYHFINLKGGGSGGSIREAGGKFGEREAAMENTYFRKLVID